MKDEVLAELKRIEPEGVETTIGAHTVFRYRMICDLLDQPVEYVFESVIKEMCDGKLIQIRARNSYDDQLAKFLFDEIASVELPDLRSETIRVWPARFPARWIFDVILGAPPLVAGLFKAESEILRAITYWVIPAFEGEFANDADGKVFWHQINREDGWHSSITNWQRKRKSEPEFRPIGFCERRS